MSSIAPDSLIGVVGAGAMGAGIAQVAAAAGHRVAVYETSPEALLRAQGGVTKNLRREVERSKLSEAEAQATAERISWHEIAAPGGFAALAEAALVIEAIIENLGAKQELFGRLEGVVNDRCILASNTSSLSIASIGAMCRHPTRVAGIHFFNPVPAMPLVEIIPSLVTDPGVITAARELVTSWGKIPVTAKDTPGFIVNRIARPFYGESLRILEEGIADMATIDWAMREIGHFRMGPFELMDFIGNDINFTVTRTVFESFFFDPRYRPSLAQQRLFEARLFGRKSGRGWYDYRPEAPKPSPREDRALGSLIVDRVVAMLINEAADALHLGIASARDIDLAMTKGVNYPQGLLAWGDELGAATVLSRLTTLQHDYGEDRYRPSVLLRRLAAEGGRFQGAGQ